MITLNKTVVILGNSKVGKTCLVTKLIKNKIETQYKETYGCDFANYEISLPDQKLNLNIWDTNGFEDKVTMLPAKLYKQAKAFIIVCSYTDYESMIDVGKWVDFIRSVMGEQNNIPIILLLNKSDIIEKKFSINDISREVKSFDEISNFYETTMHGSLANVVTRLQELLLGRSFPFKKQNVVFDTCKSVLLNKEKHKETISIAEKETMFTRSDNISIKIKKNSSANISANNHISEEGITFPKSNSIEIKSKSKCCF